MRTATPNPVEYMELYIAKNGEQLGPYTLDKLSVLLNSGAITSDDLCWYDGLNEWIFVRELQIDSTCIQRLGTQPKVVIEASCNSNPARIQCTTKGKYIRLLVILAASLVAGFAILFSIYRQPPQKTLGGPISEGVGLSLDSSKSARATLPPATEPAEAQKNPVGDPPATKPAEGQKNPAVNFARWDTIVHEIEKGVEHRDPRSMAIMSVWMSLGVLKTDHAKAIELALQSEAMKCALGGYALGFAKSISDVKAGKEAYIMAYPKLLDLAASGDPFAQYAVATYYIVGLGDVGRNIRQGIVWLNKSVSQGELLAIDLGGFLQAKRLGAPDRGYAYYLSAASRGYPHSQWVIGDAWQVGAGFFVAREIADYWMDKAAEQNYGPAICVRADRTSDLSGKLRYYSIASEQNYAHGLLVLGGFYLSGTNVPKDTDKGYEMIERCVKSETNNTTLCGVDNKRSIAHAKSILESRDKEIIKKRKEQEEIYRFEEQKTKALNVIALKYGKGKDDCYQIIIPKLAIAMDSNQRHPNRTLETKTHVVGGLIGVVQRFWPNKKNLFLRMEINQLFDASGPSLIVSAGGELGHADDLKREYEYGLFTTQNQIGGMELDEKAIKAFNDVYPIFKQWEIRFIESKEASSTVKMIKPPFAFIWDGRNASLGLIKETSVGDMVQARASSSFVDSIRYCVNQIPEMENALSTAQRAMRSEMDSTAKRVEALTK